MTSKLERIRQRFDADPSDARAFEALEEHHFLEGQWSELVALYEQRLAGEDLQTRPQGRAALLFRLGQVLEDRSGDMDRAAECYRRAIQADPGYRPALQQLRRIHTSRERWEMALQIAEVEAGLPMSGADRGALFAETASIWLDRLGDPEQASSHLEQALEADPQQPAALAAAARAHEACGRPLEAAQRWEQATPLLRGTEQARARVALARLCAGPLEQPDRATELYRLTLTEDPRNPDAVEAMAAHAVANRQWPLLADLQERRFELCSDPSRQVQIAVEAGRLELDRLSNPGAARVWFSRAAELSPRDIRIHEVLADLERQRGDDDELLRHLEQMIALGGEEQRVSVLLEAASLQTAAKHDERAADTLRRALERAPEDALIVEALSDTLSRLGQHEELIDLLERRAALAAGEPETRGSVLFELGRIQEERLDDRDSARHAYERAHEAWPSGPGVADALERLYRKQEDWRALGQMFETAGRSGEARDRARALCSLGQLLIERFDDSAGAARAYEDALGLDPRSLPAHRGLQEVAASSGNPDAVIRTYQREAEVTSDRTRLSFLVGELTRMLAERDRLPEALEWATKLADAAPEDTEALAACARLHEQLGHDEETVAALERLDPLLQSAERAENRRKLARHHAERGRLDEGRRWTRAALDLDPTHIPTLERLVALLEEAESWEELAAAQRWLSELLPDEPRTACLDALARLQAERLSDLSGAIETLLRLAGEEAPPADVEERLASAYERSERFEELVARLELRREALPPAHPDTARLAMRQARILLDELDRAESAAAVFRAALEADPASAVALEGLEHALRRAGDPLALEAFLLDRARSADTRPDRERAALERAQLLEDTIEDDDAARDAYQELVARAGDPALRARAARRLEVLLERACAWDALRRHLSAWPAEQAEDGAAAHHARIARLCRDRLADQRGAIAHFEAAAELAPEHADLWRELAALYEGDSDAEGQARALEAELRAGPDPDRELALRSRAAELRAGPLGDPDGARAHFERVLELDPNHAAAAEYLIDEWEREGRFNAVVRLLELRLDSLDDTPREADAEWKARRTSLRLRIAGICSGPLDDVDAAIAALEPALGEIGHQAVVAEPLADLYQRAGYSDDFAELCRRAAPLCSDPAERAQWFVRLGDELRGRDQREAAEAYRQALSDRPDDRQTQAALRQLYRRLGEAEPLARLLEADLARLAGAEEVPARLELASLLAGPLGHSSEALLHLRRVVEIEPGHGQALVQALALADGLRGAEDRSELSELVLEVLDGALSRMRAPEDRAALLARRARLLRDAPGQAEAAALAYRESLELNPAQAALRTELRALLEGQQRYHAVLDCLLEEAYGAPPNARAELYERGVEVARAHFSDDAALPWLERLHHETPLDPGVTEQIVAIHRAAGRHEAVLHALDLQIEKTAEAPRRRELRLEQATILEEHFGSPTRAAAALEAALADLPSDATLLEHLDRLYRAAGRPAERAHTLERMIDAGGPEERLAQHCEAASLYAGPLGDPRNAAKHLLHAVDATPRGSAVQTELLRELGDALRRAAPRDAWARCAEQELRGLDPNAAVFDERRRELHRELAHAYERELGRSGDALRHLWPLVDSPPPAHDAVRTRAFEEAELALLRLLRGEGNWLAFEARLASRLSRIEGDAEAWLELARIRDERLRTTAAAAAAYREVLAREPDCLPALRGLRGTCERLGDWAGMAHTLERELERGGVEPPAERSTLLRRLGDVYWHELQSTTRSSRSYAAALEADPHDFESLHSLERLLETMEDWRSVIDLYESETEMLGENEIQRQTEVWLRVGELARDHTDDVERALRAYVNAANPGPLPPQRRFELAELYERCGDTESFIEVFEAWCNDPDARSGAADQLRLGDAFEALEQPDRALACAERATALDPTDATAWEATARLRETRGNAAGAAEALCRVAELVPDDRAAQHLLRAASHSEGDDAEGAAALLRAAVQRDPTSVPVQASLARVTAQLGRASEAEAASRRALDLAAGDDTRLDREARIELALLGGRVASELDRAESASRFYSEALSLEPDRAEAMAGYGSALAALNDNAGAAQVLEARVAQGDRYPGRAQHLLILGKQRESEDDEEAAIECYQQARDEDPGLDDAHAHLVRLHESTGCIADGIDALERWADVAREPAERTERLLRAAAWELQVGGFEEGAERHLREVLETDPGSAHTWQALATLLWDVGRAEEALDVATRALDGQEDAALLGPLALIRGRALERLGERTEAGDAYRMAAQADPRCSEAALSGARLLRGVGDWRGTAELLQAFAERDPGEDPASLAEVLHQLARLRAGPLEDVDAAIEDYCRAVELAPERRDVRAALAELLSHRPSDWKQALAHHRILLDEKPADADTLRMLLRISRGRGSESGVARGLRLQGALGLLSPREREEAAGARRLPLIETHTLEDPLHETLRLLAVEASHEITEALEASEPPDPPDSDEIVATFRATGVAAEGRLAAASLPPLSTSEVGEVLQLVAALCLDPDQVRGEGRLVNALSAALGRRARRRLRRLLEETSLAEIQAVDFEVWRRELRALAAGIAVEESGIELREAILTLIRDGSAEPPGDIADDVDLMPWLAESPQATSLVRLAVRSWLEDL